MNKLTCSLLLGVILSGTVSAGERLWIDGRGLDLTAQARACYLGFLKLYDVDYFRGTQGDERCVRVSYLREFGAEMLAEATTEVFTERHGKAVASRYRAELGRIAGAYRSVVPGDRYLYCVGPQGEGSLLRDNRVVVTSPSADFAHRFLQIWVQREETERQPAWAFRTC